MKRFLILLLTLAISISLASVTLAVYQRTMGMSDISIGSKVFDVFAQPASSVTEPRPAVNMPEWRFTVFNNVTNSTPSDLIITVDLNTNATSGLSVDVLNSNGDVIGSSAFNGNNSASIVFLGYIDADTTIKENLTLRFSHNGLLLSPSNNPFGGTTAHYSVTVSAQPQEEEDLIEKVRNNSWLRLQISPAQAQGGNSSSFEAMLSDPPDTQSGTAGTRDTHVRIVYTPSNSVFQIQVFSGPTFVISNVDPNNVITPTGILFYGENFGHSNRDHLEVTNIMFNDTPLSPDNITFNDPNIEPLLLTGFEANADGSFVLSFDFEFNNGGHYSGEEYFGVYLGYT